MKHIEPPVGGEARRDYVRDMLQRLSTRLAAAEPSKQVGLLDRFRPPAPVHPSPYWYRVQYLLASDSAHRQLDAWQDGRKNAADEAGKEADAGSTELAIAIEEQLGVHPSSKEHAYFLRFLRDIEPSALLLWAGIVTLLEENVPHLQNGEQPERIVIKRPLDGLTLWKDNRNPEAATAVIRYVETWLKLSARSRYNLACIYAVSAMLAREAPRMSAAQRQKAEQDLSRKAIVQLDLAAPGISAATVQWARRDPCFRELRKRREFELALARQVPVPAVNGG